MVCIEYKREGSSPNKALCKLTCDIKRSEEKLVTFVKNIIYVYVLLYIH